MKTKALTFLKDSVSVITAVFPVAFSIGVCSGMGAFSGAVFSFLAALMIQKTEQKKQMPIYIAFLIGVFTFKTYGAATLSVAVAISSLLIIAASFFKDKISRLFETPVIPSVMLSGALAVTVLFTTDYFGIGATGNTPAEMISSYLSLGFHPNWRGVLYGTIVLVVMITFPRKFKNLSKTLNASFIALIGVTLLNLLLNPADMISAIRESGTLSVTDSYIFPVRKAEISLFGAIICGIAMFFPCFFAMHTEKSSKIRENACVSVITGINTCMPVLTPINRSNVLFNFISATVMGILVYFGQDFISRIPVHACAVVLIVGAWQSVKFSELKKCFSHPINALCLVACVTSYMLFGAVYGTIISAVLCIPYLFVKKAS